MALGSTQPLIEMSNGIVSGGKGRLGSREDLTAICELIVRKKEGPRRPTTLRASKACYGDSFTL
jgi:hypothetical protein